MNRIDERFQFLRQRNRKALSLFVTAGYPNPEITVPLIVELEKAGADLIELGIPFSDPIADGPTIQHSSEVALRNGITLQRTFNMVKDIRKQTEIPLILMGYANPIMSFGLEKYLDYCKSLGVDGSIIADLPLEESNEYRSLAASRDISTIFLAAPTTSNERLVKLDIASRGFLYCISVTGVTGERTGLAASVTEFINRVKTNVKNNPILIGFGIATPEDAVVMTKESDGVVIGSALIKILGSSGENKLMENAVTFVTQFRNALDKKYSF